MLPRLKNRKNSIGPSSPTPIFKSQIYENDFYTDWYHEDLEFQRDAIQIKLLKSRIGKLKKDNELLKLFILSTKVSDLGDRSGENKSNPRSKMTKEFSKLEDSLKH